MERGTRTTRVRVIKSLAVREQLADACTIITLSIFVIVGREVNGVILPLVRANRGIVTMRTRHYPSVGSLELMSVVRPPVPRSVGRSFLFPPSSNVFTVIY